MRILVLKDSGTLKQVVRTLQKLILDIEEQNKPESKNYHSKFDLLLNIKKSTSPNIQPKRMLN